MMAGSLLVPGPGAIPRPLGADGWSGARKNASSSCAILGIALSLGDSRLVRDVAASHGSAPQVIHWVCPALPGAARCSVALVRGHWRHSVQVIGAQQRLTKHGHHQLGAQEHADSTGLAKACLGPCGCPPPSSPSLHPPSPRPASLPSEAYLFRERGAGDDKAQLWPPRLDLKRVQGEKMTGYARHLAGCVLWAKRTTNKTPFATTADKCTQQPEENRC
jgi:hypothetical protein